LAKPSHLSHKLAPGPPKKTKEKEKKKQPFAMNHDQLLFEAHSLY
jgi:hypothetical protein